LLLGRQRVRAKQEGVELRPHANRVGL
jgi:hypothetical protein